MFDDLYRRRFDLTTYNCWDLVREVWLRLTGQDLGSLDPRRGKQLAVAWAGTRFTQLPGPKEPCIVLMQRDRLMPHVGVLTRGGVLHIKGAGGVQHQPLCIASLGFQTVGFFQPCTP